jgi:hypothetical protein
MLAVATASYIRAILAVAIAQGEMQNRRDAIIESAVFRVKVNTRRYTNIIFKVPNTAVGKRNAHSSWPKVLKDSACIYNRGVARKYISSLGIFGTPDFRIPWTARAWKLSSPAMGNLPKL